jgi:hypothetical protein
VLASFGAAGLATALGPCRGWALPSRLIIAAGITAVGLAAYGWLEPKCLAGPRGQFPAELFPLWMDHVSENQSIVVDIAHGTLSTALGLAVFYLVAACCAIYHARQSRKAADVFLCAVALAFAAMALWQNKFAPYGSLVALPAMAILISRVGPLGEVRAGVVHAGLLVILSQALLISAGNTIGQALAEPRSANGKPLAEACTTPANIEILNELPAGLVVSHLDLAAPIALLTHHRVLAAPYHRIANAIIASLKTFESKDDTEAAAILSRTNVDYVVECQGTYDVNVKRNGPPKSLGIRLALGQAPNFLTPVPLSRPDTIYSVWRVDRSRLNPQP